MRVDAASEPDPVPPEPGSSPLYLDDIWVEDRPDTPSLEQAEAPRRLLRDNVFVASGTLTSRITGLIRTVLVVGLLIGDLSDAYLNANNSPNMIYELILGGILTATLVPLFTDDLERGRRGDATSAIISCAVVALLGVAGVAVVVIPLMVLLQSTGSPEAVRDDYVAVGVRLGLLFAPQVFFYGLMAVWSAVLNARHRFLAAAWAPVLNNLVAIATLVVVWRMAHGRPTLSSVLDDQQLLLVLGVGTTLGITVMALSLYPSIRRSDLHFRWNADFKHPAVRRAVRLSGWTLGYVAANQLAVTVVTILAEPGSGGSTDYQTAFQFFQLPHGLLAVSIMVTFEPLLGRADARGDRREFHRHLLLGYRLIALLIIPAAIGYLALPKGLDHRTFTATGNLARGLHLSTIVAAFAIGLPGFSSYLFTLRGFYAMKNTKLPFLINCFENAVNIATAVVFVRWWGVVGLALSFSLAYTVSALVAMVVIDRRSPGFDWPGLAATWGRLLVAATAMGALVYGTVALIAPASAWQLVPTVAVGIAVGAVSYLVAIIVLRVPGIAELFARFPVARRFARPGPPAV